MASPLASSDGVIDLYTLHRFCYEVNTIRPCPPITGLYKRNFGFFYNALGKALFIIFMGLLNFGVEAGALGIVTAIAVAVDGGLRWPKKQRMKAAPGAGDAPSPRRRAGRTGPARRPMGST